MASGVRDFPTIKAVRSFVVGGVGSGGDYHNVQGGHWSLVQVDRQRHINAVLKMGAVSHIPNELGHQRTGLNPRGD
ncbi:hypothetical protein E4U52_006233 [Claviceps spartinae]|nr:hypothetical protein E4U52_006233 [Claviceps spartinae]